MWNRKSDLIYLRDNNQGLVSALGIARNTNLPGDSISNNQFELTNRDDISRQISFPWFRLGH